MTGSTTLKAHVALNVRNIKASIEFYRKLFDAEPCKTYEKYAKFDVHDPPLNLTLNERAFGDLGALFHMGIQVTTTAAVLTMRERWQRAGLETRDEMQIICGHALQDKSWVTDPDGINWEVFVVHKDKLPMFRGSVSSLNASCQLAGEKINTCERTDIKSQSVTDCVKPDLVLRKLTNDDRDEVLAIYEIGIAAGHATFQQEVPSWDEWDRSHLTDCRVVAVKDHKIVGWCALSLISERCVYAGVAEVSIYVTASHRGQGIGKALLRALIHESESSGIWTLQAGIFPENTASIALHKSCGFREVGRRERIGKMNGVWRDTMLLERRSLIAGEEENQVVRACSV